MIFFLIYSIVFVKSNHRLGMVRQGKLLVREVSKADAFLPVQGQKPIPGGCIMNSKLLASFILFLTISCALQAQFAPEDDYNSNDSQRGSTNNISPSEIMGYEVQSASRGEGQPPSVRWVLG